MGKIKNYISSKGKLEKIFFLNFQNDQNITYIFLSYYSLLFNLSTIISDKKVICT